METEEEKNERSSTSGDGKGELKQPCLRSVSIPVEPPHMEDFEEGKRVAKVTGKSAYVSCLSQY